MARGIGSSVRPVWRAVRLVALLIGLIVLAFAVDLYFRFDRYADSAVERFLANARAPLDRELPPVAHAIPYASADIQPIGGQGDVLSCSVPPFVDRLAFPRRGNLAPISLRMRQACAFHDYCYRHGAATYGYSQADCDYLLLEHAYRICRFINTSSTVSRCVTDARKVLLGVRLGGQENFKHADRLTPAPWNAEQPCPKNERSSADVPAAMRVADDSCTSSYFEFNPYPIRAQGYTVHRIADAPQSSPALMRKALYVFDIRPTATRLTIVGWTNDEKRKAYCIGYELPGAFKHLSVPPLVARSGGEGAASEDWFVWWRRFDLENTGGHLAVIAPGRASLADWTAVFAGATSFHLPESECGKLLPTGSPAGEARRASNVILIGESEEHQEDAEFSELHAAPGLGPESGKIRLMALRTHSCGAQKRPWPSRTAGQFEQRPVNALCFHDFVVDPAGPGFQKSEPYLVRDSINRWHEGTVHGDKGDGFDPDRYRNFVTAPMPLASGDKTSTPAFAWLRRGEADGTTYEASALVRRSFHRGDLGAGLPVVQLEGFEEWADPVFVFDRTGKPQLVSLRDDGGDEGAIKMHQWVLPNTEGDYSRKIGDDCARPNWSSEPRRSLNDCAQAVVPRKLIAESCTRRLDSTWLVRPAVVLPPAKARNVADIVFARVTITAPKAGANGLITGFDFDLDLRIAEITTAGECVSSSPKPLKGEIAAPRLKDNDRERQVRETIAALRSVPVLVADLEPNTRYAVVPDAKRPARTHLFPLSY